MITINLDDFGTSQVIVTRLGQIASQVQHPVAMLKVVSRRGANELRAHFRARNSVPNKLGGRKTNFWQAVADSVQNPVLETDTLARISITHPAFAQKVFGGPIRPKRGEFITIPVDPLSHGLTVETFEQETGIELFRLRKKGGDGFSNCLAGLVAAGEVKVFYVLSEGIDQDPDPNALPNPRQFNNALLDEGQQFLDREIAKKP